jgi:hypothetical protein
MNIPGPKTGALQMGHKERTMIFSKTVPTILIKYQNLCRCPQNETA